MLMTMTMTGRASGLALSELLIWFSFFFPPFHIMYIPRRFASAPGVPLCIVNIPGKTLKG